MAEAAARTAYGAGARDRHIPTLPRLRPWTMRATCTEIDEPSWSAAACNARSPPTSVSHLGDRTMPAQRLAILIQCRAGEDAFTPLELRLNPPHQILDLSLPRP